MPTAPPKPSGATTTSAVPAPLPTIAKPKLSWAQRNAANNALEGVQEWVKENEPAIRAQSHALLDRVLKSVGEYIGKAHPAVDSAIGRATTRLAGLRF